MNADEYEAEFARRKIVAVAEDVLRRAGVAGIFPTPLEVVREAVGVRELVDISDLPDEPELKKPAGWRKVLGAYVYRAETTFVDLSQPTGRRRWIESHELGHGIVPWHRQSYLDDERRLFRETEEKYEIEASIAGAHLIFQGNRFFERALEYPVSIRTPILLSNIVQASIHATLHYYVEHHPEPVAALIAGRYQRTDGTIPVWVGVDSVSFRERYGPLSARFPNKSIPFGTGPIGKLLAAANAELEPPTSEVGMLDLNKVRRKFTAEAFFNQRCYFVVVAPARRLRRGRRIQIAS